MKSPLDFHVADRTGLVKAARIFSNIVSPPVMFAGLGIAFALQERPFWPGMAWATVYGLTVSLAPLLVVLYLLRSGRIGELHMTNTRERHIPYLAAIAFAGVAYLVITLFGGPLLLRCLAIFNLLELSALALINAYWLISLHATGIMATFVLVGLIFGWPISLLFIFPFVIAVSWVRLYLKRHTPAQVVAGLGLGILTVLSLTLVGCFSG